MVLLKLLCIENNKINENHINRVHEKMKNRSIKKLLEKQGYTSESLNNPSIYRIKRSCLCIPICINGLSDTSFRAHSRSPIPGRAPFLSLARAFHLIAAADAAPLYTLIKRFLYKVFLSDSFFPISDNNCTINSALSFWRVLRTSGLI